MDVRDVDGKAKAKPKARQAGAPYTVDEACDRLRVGRTTLYGLIKAGRITPYRVGLGKRGKVLIAEREIDEFLAGCRDEVTSDPKVAPRAGLGPRRARGVGQIKDYLA